MAGGEQPGLEVYFSIAKFIWPIALWAAHTSFRLKKLETDVDTIFWLFRGRQGKRDRSIRARVRRKTFEIKKKFSKYGGQSHESS